MHQEIEIYRCFYCDTLMGDFEVRTKGQCRKCGSGRMHGAPKISWLEKLGLIIRYNLWRLSNA